MPMTKGISNGVKKTFPTALGIAAMSLWAAFLPVFGQAPSQTAELLEEPPSMQGELLLSEGNSLLATSLPVSPKKVVSRVRVVVTAYSSTPEQTDDTPFITAAGTYVREGIVAANFLPMGTKIKLPDLYGDRVFVVEDRMHPRKNYMVDIWFPDYRQAKEFGAKLTYIEVLEG